MTYQTDEELDALVQRLNQLDRRMSFQSQNIAGARTCRLSADAITALRTQLAEVQAVPEVRALVEALRPLAEMSDRYEPEDGVYDDDELECWSRYATPKIKHLRIARAALAPFTKGGGV